MSKNDDTILIVAGALLAAMGVFSTLKTANADQPVIIPASAKGSSLDDLYKKHGNLKGIDWRIIKAIAQIESNENPQAVNPTDPSYGLMQVLCRATSMTQHCSNNFPSVPRWNEATRAKLLSDVDYNIHVGATILQWNLQQYGFPKGIAVYNNWSARNDPPEGPYKNQSYVEKFLRHYAALKAIA